MIYTDPQENIKQEKAEYTKWFETILKVNNLKFRESITQNECDGFTAIELTRKVLYFDKLNNIISTHSPYGTHWENAKHIVKLTADDKFRWYTRPHVFCNSSNVYYQEYNKKPKKIFTINPYL